MKDEVANLENYKRISSIRATGKSYKIFELMLDRIYKSGNYFEQPVHIVHFSLNYNMAKYSMDEFYNKFIKDSELYGKKTKLHQSSMKITFSNGSTITFASNDKRLTTGMGMHIEVYEDHTLTEDKINRKIEELNKDIGSYLEMYDFVQNGFVENPMFVTNEHCIFGRWI